MGFTIGSMGPAKASSLLCLLVLAAAAAGCGASDREAAPPAPSGGSNRYFGEHPGQRATKAAITGADCRLLGRALERQTGASVQARSEPSPPNSRCQLRGGGVRVSISLDAAYAARQRYSNRMAEQVQFNASDLAKVPHQVPGVGDRSAGDHYASWIPAYSTLFAVRGNRWLTLAYSVAAEPRPQRLTGAAALARLGFRLTAR
jgi:hypothetical protein